MNEDMNSFKNREFICACGKNYLSYAALFTHIKQKHDGKVLIYLFRHQAPSLVLDHKGKEGVLAKTQTRKMSCRSQVPALLFIESDQPQNGILKGIDINNI